MNQIYEMANIPSRISTLPYSLWLDSAGKNRKVKHSGLRFKAEANNVKITAGFINDKFTTYKTTKKDINAFGYIKELQKFAERIKLVLEMHWNGDISDPEIIDIIKYMAKNENASILETVDAVIEDPDVTKNIKVNINII